MARNYASPASVVSVDAGSLQAAWSWPKQTT
jgi:hypothetical protein